MEHEKWVAGELKEAWKTELNKPVTNHWNCPTAGWQIIGVFMQ